MYEPLGQIFGMHMLGLEPGTWADWANAASTLLAFVVAAVLFVISMRDRRRAADDRRRDQARRVWVWSTGTKTHPDSINDNFVIVTH